MRHVAWVRRAPFVALASAEMAALWDWLFVGHVVGWTAALALAAALLLILVHSPEALRRRSVAAAAGLGLGLVIALAIEPTPLAILLALADVALVAMLTVTRWRNSVAEWLRWAVCMAAALAVRIPLDAWLARRWLLRHPAARPRVVRATAAWLVPLLLGGIFVLLFIAANPVIEQWTATALDALATWTNWLPTLISPERIVVWGVVFWATWGLLRPLRLRARQIVRVPPVQWPRRPWQGDGAAAVVRCLLVFNAVFAVQTSLDVRYLWYRAQLPAGLTYATYAQRGAYPLVATALLAALFVVITFRRDGAAQNRRAARLLVYAWIAQNVFLMASAIWRLRLYVGAYSLTYWRFAAGVWMLLVALGLGWIVLKIVARRENEWLLRVNLLTAGAVLYALAFINAGGLIADFNVRHCRELGGRGAALDIDYLSDLGPVALPALQRAAERLQGAKQQEAQAAVGALRRELGGELAEWRGWTLRRALAARRIGMDAGITREKVALMAGGR